MIGKQTLLFVLLCIICSVAAFAEPDSTETQLAWWNDIPGFLNQQHTYSLETVEALLEKYLPAIEMCLERHAVFNLLDSVFHDPEAPNYEAVQQFFLSRTRKVLDALRETTVSEGAIVWKLYNHGFIIRTATTTLAFDLVSGKHIAKEGFRLSADTIDALAEQCDVLFISHLHRDHADEIVAQAFINKEKPVVLPENLWQKEDFSDKLSYLERSAKTVHTLPVKKKDEHLKVVAYPGHQGLKLLNNVTLVETPDNITVIQTGDQSNPLDFAWIDTIKEHHAVDVLLPNCWTTNLPRMITGVDPAIVITGHENELGHSIDHREPYWLNASRLGDGISRYIAMTWGESYHYQRKPESP